MFVGENVNLVGFREMFALFVGNVIQWVDKCGCGVIQWVKWSEIMSKIIKQADKFKPITCGVCGCVYEFEKGDRIEALKLKYEFDATLRVDGLMLECPICGIANKLEKENEE